MVLAVFFVSPALLAGLAIAALIPFLRKSRVLDLPNDRSSHLVPTPRGAGLVIIPIVAAFWIALGWGQVTTHALIWPSIAALFLCALSWFDDLQGLPPSMRLGAHILVVTVLLYAPPGDVLYTQG